MLFANSNNKKFLNTAQHQHFLGLQYMQNCVCVSMYRILKKVDTDTVFNLKSEHLIMS